MTSTLRERLLYRMSLWILIKVATGEESANVRVLIIVGFLVIDVKYKS